MDKNSKEYRQKEIKSYLIEHLPHSIMSTVPEDEINEIVDSIYYISTAIHISPPTQEQLERTYQHLQIPHFTNY